jgi:hypothetical protein
MKLPGKQSFAGGENQFLNGYDNGNAHTVKNVPGWLAESISKITIKILILLYMRKNFFYVSVADFSCYKRCRDHCILQ